MSKLNQEIKDGKLLVGVDTNEDGENSLSMKLNLSEAVSEAIAKGEAVEGVKVVDFKFELTKLVIKLDTDKDGENVLELVVDIAESFDEIKSKIEG